MVSRESRRDVICPVRTCGCEEHTLVYYSALAHLAAAACEVLVPRLAGHFTRAQPPRDT
jgi:hypothetical protein